MKLPPELIRNTVPSAARAAIDGCPIEIAVAAYDKPTEGVNPVGVAEGVKGCQTAADSDSEYGAAAGRTTRLGRPIEIGVTPLHQRTKKGIRPIAVAEGVEVGKGTGRA